MLETSVVTFRHISFLLYDDCNDYLTDKTALGGGGGLPLQVLTLFTCQLGRGKTGYRQALLIFR